MKVLPFTIPKPKRDAIILQEDRQPQFYGHLHQHPEIQISWIIAGEGSLIVGDSISFYAKGDIVVLGGNLPHVFRSQQNHPSNSHMVSVFFTEASFGPQFFETEELKSLQSFFKKADNGIRISKASKRISSIFQKLQKASKLDRFLLFFQLLKELNRAKHSTLSSFISEKKYSDNEGQRMGAVFQYTMNHFREKISLEHIAKEAAMTPNAFCKYFKKRTRKTYGTFLNEVRIEAVCRQLQQAPEVTMAELAESNGFTNISNFNRQFKAHKGMHPTQFRKQFAL